METRQSRPQWTPKERRVLHPTEVLPPPWTLEVTVGEKVTTVRYPSDDPILFESIHALQAFMRANDIDSVKVIQP